MSNEIFTESLIFAYFIGNLNDLSKVRNVKKDGGRVWRY